MSDSTLPVETGDGLSADEIISTVNRLTADVEPAATAMTWGCE